MHLRARRHISSPGLPPSISHGALTVVTVRAPAQFRGAANAHAEQPLASARERAACSTVGLGGVHSLRTSKELVSRYPDTTRKASGLGFRDDILRIFFEQRAHLGGSHISYLGELLA